MRRESIGQGAGSVDAVIYEEVAHDWFEAILTCVGATFTLEKSRSRFDIWADQFFCVLESHPFNARLLRAIGAELALFYLGRPEVLGATLSVLGGAAATVKALRTPMVLLRLAAAIGELATGFTAAASDVILSPQQQVQSTYFTQLMDKAEVAQGVHPVGAGMPLRAASEHNGRDCVFRPRAISISAYVARDGGGERLSEAVGDVFRSEEGRNCHRPMAVVPPGIPGDRQRQSSDLPTTLPSLSARELDVLQLVARGCTNRHIATTLCVAEGTVKNHITHIYTKLAVRSRAEAVAWAWQQGLGG